MGRCINGTYAVTIGSILNYLLLGLALQIDHFYFHSFEIFLACMVVFPSIRYSGFTYTVGVPTYRFRLYISTYRPSFVDASKPSHRAGHSSPG
jgi:hypothetical protein